MLPHGVRVMGVLTLRAEGVGNLGHEALRLPLLALRHGRFQVAASGMADFDRQL